MDYGKGEEKRMNEMLQLDEARDLVCVLHEEAKRLVKDLEELYEWIMEKVVAP